MTRKHDHIGDLYTSLATSLESLDRYRKLPKVFFGNLDAWLEYLRTYYPSAGYGWSKQLTHLLRRRRTLFGYLSLALLFATGLWLSGILPQIVLLPEISRSLVDLIHALGLGTLSNQAGMILGDEGTQIAESPPFRLELTEKLSELIRNLFWSITIVAGSVAALTGLIVTVLRTEFDRQKTFSDKTKQEADAFASAVELFNKYPESSAVIGATVFYESLARRSPYFHLGYFRFLCARIRFPPL